MTATSPVEQLPTVKMDTVRENVKLNRRKMMSIFLFLVLLVFAYTGWMMTSGFKDTFQFEFNFHKSILLDKVAVQTDTADELTRKVRVLCFVTTMPANELKAIAVNVTWLKRCTRHLLVTSRPLPAFRNPEEVLVLSNVPEGRDHLTAKTFQTLSHLYTHELNNYDWFVKADDDVYIIMENLRLMLSKLSPNDPVYLGHHFKASLKNGYMSGGASYVLSRQALRMMGQKGFPENGGICRPKEPDEDVEVGRCLEAIGIKPYGTLDRYGRETFHPWSLSETVFSLDDSDYPLHPKLVGPDCCSQLSITFHYLSPQTMYTLEMFLYHVSVYGRHPDDVTLRQTLFKPAVELLSGTDDEQDTTLQS